MSRAWRQHLWAAPGVGFSLLPKLACPACWPAYAGLLGSVGLGFLVSSVYVLPLTVASLLLALAALVFRARQRNGYGPFFLGLAGTAAVLLAKFVWELGPTVYGGVGLLVGASLWNAWPRRIKSRDLEPCPGCESERVE